MQKKEEVEISGTAGYKRGHMGAHRAFPLSLLASLSASSCLSPIISAATNNCSDINRLVIWGLRLWCLGTCRKECRV